MRRYVHGFVNAHDPDVARSIMAAEYRLHMGSDTLVGRDEQYIPAVLHQMAQFPGLGFSIHELITDGTRTALLFSEHGHAGRPPGHGAAWRGVSIYRAEDGLLAECWVEQDHFGRRHQLAVGEPEQVRPVALDPWSGHERGDGTDRAHADRAHAERALRAWLGELASWPPAEGEVDAGVSGSTQPSIAVASVALNAFVVEGSRVAFNATISGTYQGGLPDGGGHGAAVATAIGAFARLEDGRLTGLDAISNRVLVQRQLRASPQGATASPTA
ncbi:ester cyclase [Aeromicrobium yanjiei]|uniref:ester cyclase n=1 Tax=Aeromicrobium yanjiei TaxID=2662028 RepID=UPI001892956C|nr:nuclear transport factor 2 family protein [Aeromicrobium yanjiei]